jgi:hypothetical protein
VRWGVEGVYLWKICVPSQEVVSVMAMEGEVGAAAPRQGRNCSGIRYGRRCRFCPCGGAQWSATTFLCLTCCSLSFAVGLYSGPKPYTDPKILLF